MRNTIHAGLIALLLVVGCQAIDTANPHTELKHTAQADVAVAMAIAAAPVLPEVDNTPAPSPTPKPKPGEPCPECDGTGKLGDGRVGVPCSDCNGTGKVPRPRSILPVPAAKPILPIGQSAQPGDGVKVVLRVSTVPAGHWSIEWWKVDRVRLRALGFNVTLEQVKEGQPVIVVCGRTCATIEGRPTITQVLQIAEDVK
jgi:hypothetical protein